MSLPTDFETRDLTREIAFFGLGGLMVVVSVYGVVFVALQSLAGMAVTAMFLMSTLLVFLKGMSYRRDRQKKLATRRSVLSEVSKPL